MIVFPLSGSRRELNVSPWRRVRTSSDFQQQLLQDGLLEVIEANRLDRDVPFAAYDVVAIVHVESFGRLWRKNIFRRLHDNWQAIDNHPFRNQRVADITKATNALIIVSVSGNIN